MKLKDWLAFLALGLAWGSSFLWIKIAVQEIGPFTLVALRLLFGVIGLLAVVAYNRPRWPGARRIWWVLVVLGLTNTAVPFVLISWGELFIDSAVAAVLNSTVPLFTMLIAHVFLSDDRITLPRITGLLVGFGGVIVLLSRDLDFQSGLSGGVLGQGAVLLAALFYAGSGVYARRNTQGLSPIVQALVPLVVADSAIWLAVPLTESPFTLPQIPLTWIAILWLGLIGSCIAYLLYYYLLHSVGPTRTTLVTYVFPLVGVALGVIFLNEVLDWHLFVGGTMVVGSIAVVNWR
ncbi:MAG TPA: DMT family transporter [Anaerolineales bacterium]